MWEAIAGLLAIAAILAREFLTARARQERAYAQDLEDMDRAIADGDSDSISVLFEQLRKECGSDTLGPIDQTPPEREL